nr:hypothetical protein [Maliibacterium massiliense]
MKKTGRLVIIALVLLLAAACALLISTPQTFFHESGEKKAALHRVTYIAPDGTYEDMTARVDLDELGYLLSLMKGSRYRKSFAPYPLQDVRYELDGICAGRPFHIVLGDADVNYLYESADQGGYRIQNSAVWLRMMEMLRRNNGRRAYRAGRAVVASA